MPESITLIIPPSVFLQDERVFMSIGPLKVAASLEKRGVVVRVLDLSGISNYIQVVSDYAAYCQPNCFGITATSPQLPAAMAIAKAIKNVSGQNRLILGGPHVTLVNAARKKNPSERATRDFQEVADIFDVLVAGDGEEAIFEAIKPDAPKLIDADDPKVANGLFLSNQQLDDLPFPARHLLDVNSYHYSIDGERALSIIAQLGCPFACGFCGGRSSPAFRKIRMRSSESIVAEMEHLHKTYGVNGFMFYDDELNVNKKIVELMSLISQKQKELGVQWKLRGFIKAELFTDEQARIMYEAGFRWILTGFESGSPQILENINKKATRDENTQCMEIAKRHGLKVKALMSIGHPGESFITTRETEQWLLDTKPDDFDVTIITTYPGTPYYDQAVKHESLPSTWVYTYHKTGDRLYQQDIRYGQTANYYKGRPDGGYQSFVFTDHLSSEQLVSERDRIERNVRKQLAIPFNSSAPALSYEHSMGQSGQFPAFILKS